MDDTASWVEQKIEKLQFFIANMTLIEAKMYPTIGKQERFKRECKTLIQMLGLDLTNTRRFVCEAKFLNLAQQFIEIQQIAHSYDRRNTRSQLYESAYQIYLDHCELDSIIEEARYSYTKFLEVALDQSFAQAGPLFEIIRTLRERNETV